MRILKYLLFISILFIIGLSVFVMTQKGDFIIKKSRVIKSTKPILYNYVNDYKNWGTFSSWSVNDNQANFTYSKKTAGNGATYSWETNKSDGDIKTINCKTNKNIRQTLNYNGSNINLIWTFKDTLGKTKVTCFGKGKMNIKMKFLNFINNGSDNEMNSTFEQTLANLDKALVYELNTFSIKINGIVKHNGNFYLDKTINSYSKNVNKNIKTIVSNLYDYSLKNKLILTGKPFVIYNKNENDIINFSVGIPIQDSITIYNKGGFSIKKMDTIKAIKTTLKGDYAHLQKTKDSAIAYFNKNKYKPHQTIKPFEVYIKSSEDVKQQSKWVTEYFIPIYQKPLPPKPVIKNPSSVEIQNSNNENTNTEDVKPKLRKPKKKTSPAINQPDGATEQVNPEQEIILPPKNPL